MPSDRYSRIRQVKGNEIIELALILPLLVLLLAGSVEIGRAFYTYNILTKSVRHAARYLSAAQISPSGTISGTYITRARNLSVYGNVAGTGPTILSDLTVANITVPAVATPGTSANEFYVTVSANYQYSPLFGFVLSSVSFQPKVTMAFVGVITGT